MSAEPSNGRMCAKRGPKKNKPSANPLIRGIVAFYDHRSRATGPSINAGSIADGNESYDAKDTSNPQLTISDLPKRYTAYPPLLLLPFNFATHSPAWTDFYTSLSEDARTDLFRCIAEEGFQKLGISRVAINAPIAPDVKRESEYDATEEDGLVDIDAQDPQGKPQENILRSPSGLTPVYGDWGPPLRPCQHQSRILNPTTEDFNNAFWTSTSQHADITQIWAPLYTMFSRGNISEKARILGLQSRFPGLTPEDFEDQSEVKKVDVVDFYVGIGYFAFCYLKRGVRRVYGWDINPWSIEGLRRGCERNGWRCVVVRVGEDGGVERQRVLDEVVRQIQEGDADGREEMVVRCVAVLGDNKSAIKVLQEMQAFEALTDRSAGTWLKMNVRHANLGLLPTSRASWHDAVRAFTETGRERQGGWMHVHENVDINEIDLMGEEMVANITELVQAKSTLHQQYNVSCAHVEQVKTYAPGVMHCVFDIEIRSNS